MPRRLLALVSALLLALPVMTAARASAATETWTFRSDGSLSLRGHGYGHGHGMSQYGAQGAARKGLTESQILRFYYPGTSQAKFTARIAVLITADTTDDLMVRWQQGLQVKDRATGRMATLPRKAGVWTWRLTTEKGRTIVQFYRDGAWRRYWLGGKASLQGDGEFAATSGRLTLVLPRGATAAYRGVLRHSRPSATSWQRDTVNVLDIDSYVKGVVPAEMPATWHPEAVQAQAIAARTYGLHQRATNLQRHYQICDTSRCQVYRGIAGEHSASNAAVQQTAQRYLTYKGEPAFTQFSASSGGWTSAGSRPYLVRRQDPYDGWSGNPVHNWTAKVNKSALQKRYRSIGTVRSLTVLTREGGGDWGGRILTARVNGSAGSQRVTGADLRSVWGLRSTWFTKG